MSEPITPFDLLHSPLSGRVLIEASAGTGKTYTIAGLVLRFLIEKNIPIEQMLIVTFTEAATEELKGRIRRRIVELREALDRSSEDKLLLHLLSIKTAEEIRQLVTRALLWFDEASISTIHGFCQRALKELAFESGRPFEVALEQDKSGLIEEVAADILREYSFSAPPEILELAGGMLSISGLTNLYRLAGTRLIPDDLPAPDDLLADYRIACEGFHKAWLQHREEFWGVFGTFPGFKANMIKIDREHWDKAIDDFFDRGMPAGSLPGWFSKVDPEYMARAVKKGFEVPDHPVIELIVRFNEEAAGFQKAGFALKRDLVRRMEEGVASLLEQRNLRSFDDLLNHLDQALQSEGGGKLATALRTRYQVALIDEFQDTDPVQYRIFSTVFGADDHPFFMIGDPKQAIYSFRGGDIFTYMKAAAEAPYRYTLEQNWRSKPGLVEAVEELFSRSETPFAYDTIPYIPVTAAKDDRGFRENGEEPSPFVLWHLRHDRDKALPVDASEELVAEATAAEITRLLALGATGETEVDGRGVLPRDIAVLVRTGRQARMMQELLAPKGIPTVLYSNDNLFSSAEAEAMGSLLAALVTPSSLPRVRTALATLFFGYDAQQLFALQSDETALNTVLERFLGYHHLLIERGFMIVLRTILAEGATERILSRQGGDRMMTNILHLAEIIHSANSAGDGIASLLGWYRRQVGGEGKEHELRLETDEEALKIITMHRSKGLQYPIVFAPFCWGKSKLRRGEDPVFHEAVGDELMRTIDLGSSQIAKHTAEAEREILAENIRLLYVAVTRAQYRCYLAWGRFSGYESSALAYLLHSGTDLDGCSDETLAASLGHFSDAVSVSLPPGKAVECRLPSDEVLNLQTRTFTRALNWRRTTTSFSGLTHGIQGIHTPTEKGWDEPATPELPAPVAFPRGAGPGSSLHDILENLDFAEPVDAQRPLIREHLSNYGIDAGFEETVVEMLERVMTVPLPIAAEGLTLRSLPARDRLAEMGFSFSLAPGGAERLMRLLAEEGAPWFREAAARLTPDLVADSLKGFIDLSFRTKERYFILDWKSNDLGRADSAYERSGMERVMRESWYFIQYHLYILALHLHLKATLSGYDYDSHIGGALYLFLRGVDNGGRGIFFDRPERTLIERMAKEVLP